MCKCVTCAKCLSSELVRMFVFVCEHLCAHESFCFVFPVTCTHEPWQTELTSVVDGMGWGPTTHEVRLIFDLNRVFTIVDLPSPDSPMFKDKDEQKQQYLPTLCDLRFM